MAEPASRSACRRDPSKSRARPSAEPQRHPRRHQAARPGTSSSRLISAAEAVGAASAAQPTAPRASERAHRSSGRMTLRHSTATQSWSGRILTCSSSHQLGYHAAGPRKWPRKCLGKDVESSSLEWFKPVALTPNRHARVGRAAVGDTSRTDRPDANHGGSRSPETGGLASQRKNGTAERMA